MASLHRTFARRIQRAGYQTPRRKATGSGQQSDTVRTKARRSVELPAPPPAPRRPAILPKSNFISLNRANTKAQKRKVAA